MLAGLWEVPFNAHYVETYEGGHCPYLDQCVLHNHDSDEVSTYFVFVKVKLLFMHRNTYRQSFTFMVCTRININFYY